MEQTTPPTNGTARSVVPSPPPAPAPRAIVMDSVAVFDTARFEHMQRIAVLMARTSMIPDCLKMSGDEPLDDATVVANCFMVVNQADRWRMDPFAVAQCCSVVHGRLMYEGKLVAAVLEANLGVRLKYTFDNKPEKQLGVIVSGTIPGEYEARMIGGSVERWHRGPKSPWANPLDWQRQLRYMGAREWARAHAPSLMLGVVSQEEAEAFTSQHAMMDVTPARVAAPPPAPPPAPPALDGDEPEPETDDTVFDADSFVDALDEEMAVAQDVTTVEEIWAEAQPFLKHRVTATERERADKVHEFHLKRMRKS